MSSYSDFFKLVLHGIAENVKPVICSYSTMFREANKRNVCLSITAPQNVGRKVYGGLDPKP